MKKYRKRVTRIGHSSGLILNKILGFKKGDLVEFSIKKIINGGKK